MANTDVYGDVCGAIFKVRRPAEGQADDKTYFTLKSYSTGKFVSCTLWDNSHGHVKVKDGDVVFASGKVTKQQKDDKTYVNLSVFRIAVIAMDEGVRDKPAAAAAPAAAPAADGDAPDKDDVM